MRDRCLLSVDILFHKTALGMRRLYAQLYLKGKYTSNLHLVQFLHICHISSSFFHNSVASYL